jgi:hypothetical protein
MYGDDKITAYTFGPIEFRTRGLGLFYATEKLQERIKALSTSDLQAANKAAWKQRRAAERQMDRYNNVTVHGCYPYDLHGHDYFVAKEICSLTWKALQGQREAA